MDGSSEKALRLKAQRAELERKLHDWESTWQIIHGRPATDHDRHKSHEHRELSRLLVDVDEYVNALERGTANSVAPQVASKDAERRAASRTRTRSTSSCSAASPARAATPST